MNKLIIVGIMSVALTGCIAGVRTGPLTDPEVLSQRCAEANLAITAFEIVTKGKNEEQANDARAVLNAVCSGGVITDYPSALNAISNALLLLKK